MGRETRLSDQQSQPAMAENYWDIGNSKELLRMRVVVTERGKNWPITLPVWY